MSSLRREKEKREKKKHVSRQNLVTHPLWFGIYTHYAHRSSKSGLVFEGSEQFLDTEQMSSSYVYDRAVICDVCWTHSIGQECRYMYLCSGIDRSSFGSCLLKN